MEQAYALAERVGDPPERLETAFELAEYSSGPESLIGRVLLEGLYPDLSERDERRSADALWYLSLVELAAGRLALAADYAERQREISHQYTIDEHEHPLAIWVVARIAATAGSSTVRASSRSGVAHLPTPSRCSGPARKACWGSLPPGAASRRRPSLDLRPPTRAGTAPVSVIRATSGGGRSMPRRYLRSVASATPSTCSISGRRPRHASDASACSSQVTRCRGLVAAARGDVDEALALFEQAVGEHETVGDPFGGARALLALGILRRRARQKRDAREAMAAALEAFELIGALGWAANARAELGSIGGRRRQEGLTAAERRVAALVAEGRTNREVAAALFLGERTVETHLSHVYAKLGIRSRAEIGRMYRPDEAGEQSSGGLTISS